MFGRCKQSLASFISFLNLVGPQSQDNMLVIFSKVMYTLNIAEDLNQSPLIRTPALVELLPKYFLT